MSSLPIPHMQFGGMGSKLKRPGNVVDIGCWVDWVTSNGKFFSFASNIDMPDKTFVAKRVEPGKACLRELGIY